MKENEKLRRTNPPEGALFEGIVSFRAVLAGGRKILRLLYDEKKSVKQPKELAFLRAKAAERGFSVDLLPRERLDELAVGSSHGGLLFFCEDRVIPTVTAGDLPENGFFVLLDGIEDPYNFGYALRSLYAAGVDGVLLPERNWMSAAGTVCRASAGARRAASPFPHAGAGSAPLPFPRKGLPHPLHRDRERPFVGRRAPLPPPPARCRRGKAGDRQAAPVGRRRDRPAGIRQGFPRRPFRRLCRRCPFLRGAATEP